MAVIAAEGTSLFSQHLYLAGAKGFSKGLEIGEYSASIVCLCVLERLNLRIPPSPPHTHRLPGDLCPLKPASGSLLPVFTSVLSFSHRYANQTRVINRSVTGIMQINKERASGDGEEIEECVSANLCWHSAERDSVVWNGWITAAIVLSLFRPD